MNKISDLKKILNNYINKLNKKYIIRNRKLSIKDIIYGLSLKTINHQSYDKVVYNLNKKLSKKTSKTFSSSAFKKKSDIIEYNDIVKLNNELLNNIYIDKYKRRLLSVDGSYLKTLKKLNKDGLKFHSTNHTNYTNSIISGLYDIDKKIIINYNHSINKNEREAFIEQFKYIRKGDILIFDRGYYSEKLVDLLNKNNIDYIFRIKKNIDHVKYLIENKLNEYVYKINNKLYKLVNYNINSEEYYIITSLIGSNIEELKNLYWKRWSIETHFKEAKYTTSLNEIKCKSLNNLLKEINIHNHVYILYYYFYSYIKHDSKKYELNHKIGLEIFLDDILYPILYKKKYKNDILNTIYILPKTYKHIDKNRHFKRESKIKPGSWYIRPEKYRKKNKEIQNITENIEQNNI
jgi:hypothetical protein